MLLHCIFSHAYRYDRVEQELWDVAVDMAVENVAMSLGISGLETVGDAQRRETLAQWKKISERIKAELKSFSEDKSDDKSGDRSILQNLEEATKEHYDYGDFLRRFSVSGEEMQINDDEFDYVYYTYGLFAVRQSSAGGAAGVQGCQQDQGVCGGNRHVGFLPWGARSDIFK